MRKVTPDRVDDWLADRPFVCGMIQQESVLLSEDCRFWVLWISQWPVGMVSPESEALQPVLGMPNRYGVPRFLNLTVADVDHQRWNTSVPKLIDDAIIGFFKTLEAMGTAPASQNGAGVRGNPSE